MCLPTKKSSVIYEFTCKCESGYVGRTTQRLGDRIKQHVPSNIRNKNAPQREQPPRSCRSRNTFKPSDSAIGQHLLDNQDSAKRCNGDMFRTIGRARSSFNLAVLESIYIQTKKPPLCRQKEFVFSLGLQWLFFFRHATLICQLYRSCACVFDWPISIHNWVYIILTFYALMSVRRKSF